MWWSSKEVTILWRDQLINHLFTKAKGVVILSKKIRNLLQNYMRNHIKRVQEGSRPANRRIQNKCTPLKNHQKRWKMPLSAQLRLSSRKVNKKSIIYVKKVFLKKNQTLQFTMLVKRRRFSGKSRSRTLFSVTSLRTIKFFPKSEAKKSSIRQQ